MNAGIAAAPGGSEIKLGITDDIHSKKITIIDTIPLTILQVHSKIGQNLTSAFYQWLLEQ
jgi:hypothetical protein